MNSDLNLEYEKRCLQITRTSYDHLPTHLKPCFLYMGVFPEDSEISRSNRCGLLKDSLSPFAGKALNRLQKST